MTKCRSLFQTRPSGVVHNQHSQNNAFSHCRCCMRSRAWCVVLLDPGPNEMAPWYVLTSRLGTSPQPAYNTNGHPVLDTYLGGPQLSLDLFRVDIGTGISIVSLSARSCHLCCSTANLSPALLPANDVEPNATAHILVTSLPQPFSTIPAESMARTLMTGRARALPSSRPTASVRLHAAIEVNCSAANTPRRGPAKLRTRRTGASPSFGRPAERRAQCG